MIEFFNYLRTEEPKSFYAIAALLVGLSLTLAVIGFHL